MKNKTSTTDKAKKKNMAFNLFVSRSLKLLLRDMKKDCKTYKEISDYEGRKKQYGTAHYNQGKYLQLRDDIINLEETLKAILNFG